MPYQDDFYQPPGPQFEPGDVFLKIPFPSLKYPLTYWRMRPNDPKTAGLFDTAHDDPRPGTDSPKSSVELKTVMLLSHGCEVDRVLKWEPPDRRHWLAAPLCLLKGCLEKTRQRTRDRVQPNKFYLPPSPYTDNEEFFVDLRKITPVNCKYFLDATHLCSLTGQAQKALFAQLGVFFSGYALYITPISCPACGTQIDASRFRLDSGDEPDAE